MSKQPKLERSSKSRKSEQKAKWPKTDARHWQGRLFRNSFTRDGVRQETANFCVKIGHLGRRETFNLGTPNGEAASARALRIYKSITGAGWNVALAEFKPETVKQIKTATVGTLIETARRLSAARTESLDAYAKALRRITAGILGIGNGRKYDFKQGSHEWRKKIDETPLDKLTPAALLAWKNAYLKECKTPTKRNSAAVTINSLLRSSKALLSKKIRPFVAEEITLPAVLWFDGVPTEKEPSLRYHSQIDAAAILSAASEELANQQPEVFKALLLTLICGLRRSEADSLLWSQIDLTSGTLNVIDTEHKALKSADSAGMIALDAELVPILLGLKGMAKGDFVLETPKGARAKHREHSSRTYRCDATQKALIQWLKSKGVSGQRPIHTLRKEIGSIIATRDGIFAASRYLRHSDIRITSRLYADSKTLISAGLGALLKAPTDNIVKIDFEHETKKQTARERRAK